MNRDLEPWTVTEARHIFLGGACRCTEETCAVHLDIAEEMQAQREMGVRIGRREREAEIVGWLRTAAAECGAYSGNSFVIAADKIERGAGRKEDK